jgi:hypothetical protein
VRGGVERLVRAQFASAEVRLLGARWVSLNGVQWREVALEQHYAPGVSEMRRVIHYSGQAGWIIATIIFPNHDHYKTVADKLFSTFQAPETELDRLIAEAARGAPAVYRGRKVPYRWALRPVWRPADISKYLAALGETGQELRKVLMESYEHVFNLGDGRFASVYIKVADGEIDFARLEAIGKVVYESTKQSLESGMPGYRFRFDLEKPVAVNISDRKWAQFKTIASFSKDHINGHFATTQRVTNHKGKLVSVEANVVKEHPEIRRIVQEALDAINFVDK